MSVAGTVRLLRGKIAAVAVAVAVSVVLLVVAWLVAAPGSAGHPGVSGPSGGLAAGRVGPRWAVPWRLVGPGWVLAEYWPGRFAYEGRPVPATATLYLVDPAGGRYRLYQWPAATSPPYVVDWSADETRALLLSPLGGGVKQLVLRTGAIGRIRFPAGTRLVGYTRPGGEGLLGWREAGNRAQLALYSLTGRRVRVLVAGAATAVSSPAGAVVAVPGATGVRLVSDDGGASRTLPVPGTSRDGCSPSRWWNAVTILASCRASGVDRMWLVPASGAAPMPLTPGSAASSADPGDVGAWQLPGSLYFQALGSNGHGLIFRQTGSGPVTQVTVPRTAGDNWILAADGRRILISASTPCSTGTALLWFSPSTRREQIVFKPPHGLAGVLSAVPYGQPTAPIYIGSSCAVKPRRPWDTLAVTASACN